MCQNITKGKLKYLPNSITLLRIVFGLIIFFDIIIYGDSFHFYFVLTVGVLSEISDLLDGIIARRLNIVSKWGEILDPMSDAMYRSTIFLCFAILGWISFIVPLIIIYRDTIISYLRIRMAQKGFQVKSRMAGKVKAYFQAIGGALIIIPEYYQVDIGIPTSLIISILVVVATLYSGFDYFYFGYYRQQRV